MLPELKRSQQERQKQVEGGLFALPGTPCCCASAFLNRQQRQMQAALLKVHWKTSESRLDFRDSGWAQTEQMWCVCVSKAQSCFGGHWVSHWWKTNKWVITLTEWLGYGHYFLQNPSEVSMCWLQQGKILSGHHDHDDLSFFKLC